MRGGFVHNTLMAAPLMRRFMQQGGKVFEEYLVVVDGAKCAIDLWVEKGEFSIAVELECSPRRVAHDCHKARAAGAGELWIVVPESRLVALVQRRIPTYGSFQHLSISVLTLGAALQRVTDLFSNYSDVNTHIRKQ